MNNNSISKSLFISGLTVLGLLSCNSSEKKEKSDLQKPNILFIFTDQQTINAMSCSGNSSLETPAMDYLAKAGVRFEQSYCTSPVCSPSRSSFITSRMPHETGYDFNLSPRNTVYDIEFPNMGEIFSEAGYRTVWGGKWHLPESYPLRGNSTQRTIPGFETLHFYDTTANYPEWGYGDTTDTYLADAVVSFIENYDDEQPFLLSVSFCNPHDVCYIPRKPDRYPIPQNAGELPPLPANFEIISNEPELIQKKRIMDYYGDEILLTREYDDADWQNYIYHYYRMTERVDLEIGRVINALKERALEENTLLSLQVIMVMVQAHIDGQQN